MKVCIASPDIVGPIRNGGVGTACTALAQALSEAGHNVTLFYTSSFYETGSAEFWKEYYNAFGITFLALDRTSGPPVHTTPTVYDQDNIERSYRVYEQLKRLNFDVIHFVDYIGLGYFTALAKSQGLFFSNSILAVTTHSPTLWSRLANAANVDDISYLIRDRMERILIESADIVISPSQYMLNWIKGQGWQLPSRQVVIQNLLPKKTVDQVPPQIAYKAASVDELVFFGRLEPRKGLLLFCDAIDRVRSSLPEDISITFMGKIGNDYPEPAILARAEKWGRPVKVISNLDTFGAIEYLSQPGRLAVLAALHDNSPYTTLECLFYGIPFISSDVGGVSELIHDLDKERVLYSPTPAGLADHLFHLFTNHDGAFLPSRPAVDYQSTLDKHLALHADLETEVSKLKSIGKKSLRSKTPLVTFNVLHYERPEGLARALASINGQTYGNIEIVVVDNGSKSEKSRDYLDSLESDDRQKVRIVRLNENLYEPAARNIGAYNARGDYVLFMDDDNIAKPHEAETFVHAAEVGGADVLTCFNDHFADDEPPVASENALKRFIVMGDFGPLGLIINSYGDLNCFARRDKFLDIGGFVVDGHFNHAEDWRFFAKAWSRGLKVSVVPEALLWYKTSAGPGGWGQGWRKRDRNGALARAAEVYMASAPKEVEPFLRLSQGLFWKAVNSERARTTATKELNDKNRELQTAQDRLENLQLSYDMLLRDFSGLFHLFEQEYHRSGPGSSTREQMFSHMRSASLKYMP